MRRPESISSIAVALCLGVLAGSASAKDWSSVRIATEGAYPPWNATDSSGQLVGVEIDLANDLCRRMKVTREIVAQDWEGIIPALQAGKHGVGVQVATTHANFLEAYMADAIEIRKYDTQEDLDLDLQAGRVDLALAAMSYWQPLLETEKGKDFTVIGPGMSGGPFGAGAGVGIRQEDDDLVAMFNKAIAEAQADGTIAKLSEQWFGFDASS
jgi:ABC-type amino acid transport substrate-binding protein